MNRPREYEFTPETKLEALKRANFRCEGCGVPKREARDGYLEIHHVLGVAAAIKFYPSLAPAIISSLANAQVLCKDCHQQEDNRMQFNHPKIAHSIISMLATI